jgi:hypothetical protein
VPPRLTACLTYQVPQAGYQQIDGRLRLRGGRRLQHTVTVPSLWHRAPRASYASASAAASSGPPFGGKGSSCSSITPRSVEGGLVGTQLHERQWYVLASSPDQPATSQPSHPPAARPVRIRAGPPFTNQAQSHSQSTCPHPCEGWFLWLCRCARARRDAPPPAARRPGLLVVRLREAADLWLLSVVRVRGVNSGSCLRGRVRRPSPVCRRGRLAVGHVVPSHAG